MEGFVVGGGCSPLYDYIVRGAESNHDPKQFVMKRLGG